MAGIKRAHDESCLDALKRANDDDTPAEAYIYDQTVPPMHE
jgi:hypothetical protein